MTEDVEVRVVVEVHCGCYDGVVFLDADCVEHEPCKQCGGQSTRPAVLVDPPAVLAALLKARLATMDGEEIDKLGTALGGLIWHRAPPTEQEEVEKAIAEIVNLLAAPAERTEVSDGK